MARRNRRRRRSLSSRSATLPAAPLPRYEFPARTRRILSCLDELPRLAADLGLRVAAHPDGNIEVLPGSPTTLLFHAGGKLQGLFIFASETDLPRSLRLGRANRDTDAERLWEEQRRDDHERLAS